MTLTDPISPLDAWLAEQWAIKPETLTVEAEGAQLACLGWNLKAHDRPGLILVAGFRAHAHWWGHIAPTLAADFRVVAVDLSGMGDSDSRSTYSRAQHGREIAAVGAALGFDRPIVVAHSYGGIVALTHAAEHPDAFRRLAILDAALPIPDDQWHAVPEVEQRLYATRDEILGRFRLIPPGLWPVPAILDHIAEHSIRETPTGWTWKFDPMAIVSLNIERRTRPALAAISTPADFIYGLDSEVVRPRRLETLGDVMPNAARPIALPLCHHHLMIEQPLALLAALGGLLATETV